uniref:Uncharacterized protein n=1 Tax=Rhizophora mucronata TaxID=61149 RepID=A0A2P2Q734_RHIMU
MIICQMEAWTSSYSAMKRLTSTGFGDTKF